MITRVVVIFSIVSVVLATEFASQLRKCRVNDNVALNQCLYQTLEDLRPSLLTGIPELGLPVLEPMRIHNLVFRQGDGAVSVEAQFLNAIVTGLSSFNTTFISADPVRRVLQVSLSIPQLRITGNYVLDGSIIIISVSGNGPFRANLNGVDVNGRGQVGVVKSPTGVEQLRLSNTQIDFNIKRLSIRLENLFNGDPILGETVNHFLNENSQEILREIKPEVSSQLGNLVEKVMNDALSQLPVDAFLIA